LTATLTRNAMYARVTTAEAPSQFLIADIVGIEKEKMKYAAPVTTM
jgi:hypothetical protein